MMYVILCISFFILFGTTLGMDTGNKQISTIVHEELKDSECAICFLQYDTEKKKRVDLVCDKMRPTMYHSFCKQCLNEWLKKNKYCPTCKQTIELPKKKSCNCLFACLVKH